MDALLIPLFVLSFVSVPLLGLTLLLYAVPVHVTVRFIIREGYHGQILEMSWGVLGIRASVSEECMVTDVLILDHAVFSPAGAVAPDRGEEAPNTPDQPLPVHPGSPEDGSLQASEIFSLVGKTAGPVGSFLAAFWRQSRFEEARGKVVLGVDDPVLTGEICGMYWASRFLFEACRIYIDFEPVFDRRVLELDVAIRMKVRHPLLLLIAGLGFARQPAVKEAANVIRVRRRGEAGA